jgi:heme exporter protein A
MDITSASRNEPTLELRDLGCARSGRWLFSGLAASLKAGQLLRVEGANGAGKTSLLRTLCGLLAPSRGAVLWRGEPIGVQREAFGRDLVHLGPAAALKDELPAYDNLFYANALAGALCTPAAARAALVAAGLRGRDQVPVRLLSQGQRRRAVLARLVLGSRARLWLLDEPFNALDTAASAWLRGLLLAQLESGGIVVLASHQSVPLTTSQPPMVLAL